MAFLTDLTSRVVSAVTPLTRQHEPILRVNSSNIRTTTRVSEAQIARHRVIEHASPTDVRMNFITTNRPTEREIREFERQFISALSPRIPASEIRSTTSYEVTNNRYITVLSSRAEFTPTSTETVQIKSITAEKLLKTMPCCLYGSRGIGLEHADDFDIAISIEDTEILKFIHYLEDKGAIKINIKDYAESSPESGYYGLYRFQDANDDRIDLLVLYLDEDIDIIRSTINDLRRIPQYFLTNKKQRVAMYNQGLRHRGWREGIIVNKVSTQTPVRTTISYRRPGTRAGSTETDTYTALFGPRDSERWDF